MLDIKIRYAKPDDLKRIRSITRQAYKIPIKTNGFVTGVKESRNLKADLMEGKLFIMVAEIDTKIVGAVRYEIVDNSVYFFRLAVLKTYRKKGIAAKLLERMEKNVRKDNYDKILLDCAEEKDLPLYYKKFGFEIDKIIDHHHYHGVYMSKKLN